jgi:hypothetical protein
MRTWLSSLAAGLVLLGFAASSDAAQLPFRNGRLSVQISTLQPIAVPTSGPLLSGTLNGSIGASGVISATLPAGLFATTQFVVPVTDPGAAPIAGVQATVMNAAGAFTAAGGGLGGFGGEMGLVGVNKVCLFAACPQSIANVTVPVSVVGKGGTATAALFVNVTVGGAVWTTGTLMIPTAMGGTIPTQGSLAAPTAGGYAAVKLVTPIFVSTNIGSSAIVPSWAFLEFEVPEPDLLALGFGAVGALVVVGLRRRKA